MRANCWMGRNNVEVKDVPDPTIMNPRDAIVKVTSTAICGSDLHLYDGYIPTMEKGDILGHEFMGEVVEVGTGRDQPRRGRPGGRAVPDRLRRLQRLCRRLLLASARTPTPTPAWPRSCGATPSAGMFGYSHLTGGFAGGQAEYVRVPVRRRRTDQDRERSARREGALPLRHLPDRVHGRGDVRHQARRRRRGLGRRSGGAARHGQRVPARRGARSSPSTGSTTGCRWPATRPAPRRSTTTRSTSRRRCERSPPAVARTPASTRSGWRRTPTSPRCSCTTGSSRPSAWRPTGARAAPGHHGLPQRRHGLGDRGVRRADGQVPGRVVDEPLDHPARPASATSSATPSRCWSGSSGARSTPAS